jgi:hypothetical protein
MREVFFVATLLGPYTTTTACVPSIPVTTTHQGWTVIYSLAIPNLQPSNILHLQVQAEMSNGAVSLDWALIRTDSASSTTGTYLKTPVSMTFMPEQHHYAIELWAFDTGAPTGTAYYNLLASAKSSQATSGQIVIVQEGYGNITGLVFENATACVAQ